MSTKECHLSSVAPPLAADARGLRAKRAPSVRRAPIRTWQPRRGGAVNAMLTWRSDPHFACQPNCEKVLAGQSCQDCRDVPAVGTSHAAAGQAKWVAWRKHALLARDVFDACGPAAGPQSLLRCWQVNVKIAPCTIAWSTGCMCQLAQYRCSSPFPTGPHHAPAQL
eukprot:364069-Chlamydomonas_euryale.AAC.8